MEDEFLKLDVPQSKEESDGSSGFNQTSFSTADSDTSLLNKNNVIERTIFTKTTFRIYPNGLMSPPQSQSWFSDKGGVVVKPKTKKVIELKETKLSKEEVY